MMFGKSGVLAVLVCMLTMVVPYSGQVYGFEGSISMGVGRMEGDTTYRMGGVFYGPDIGAQDVTYPLSELEFPLDVYMAHLDARFIFGDRWEVNIGGKTNITDPDSTMTDADYYSLIREVDSEGNTVSIRTAWDLGVADIYSESDAELTALSLDANLRYRFYGGLYVGIGFMYQNFDFDLSNVRQWYPISDQLALYDPSYYQPGVYGHGPSLTYEVTYYIPYLELAARGFIKENIFIEGYFRYAPMVQAEDEDHHLLREPPFKAEGDCDGNAFAFGLKGQWRFSRHWFLDLKFEMMKVETDGTQDQYTAEGVYQWTNDEEIETKQVYTVLQIGFMF